MTNQLSVEIEKEVPFYDVDAYQIAWHGHYPKYFEEARVALLEKIGFSYDAMEASGYLFPVVELSTKYIQTMEYKQRVKVTAKLKQWEHKLVVDYLITDAATGEKINKASTTQVAVLMPEKILQYQSPQELIDKIELFIHQQND